MLVNSLNMIIEFSRPYLYEVLYHINLILMMTNFFSTSSFIKMIQLHSLISFLKEIILLYCTNYSILWSYKLKIEFICNEFSTVLGQKDYTVWHKAPLVAGIQIVPT